MKQGGIKGFILLQLSFFIYSCSSVVAKFASGNDVLSFRFIFFYGLDVVILGVYALLWQQAIKRYELSIAYANKAITLLWALMWSVFLFKDTIRWNHIVGIIIVMIGIIVLNTSSSKSDDAKSDIKKEEE